MASRVTLFVALVCVSGAAFAGGPDMLPFVRRIVVMGVLYGIFAVSTLIAVFCIYVNGSRMISKMIRNS